MRILLIGLGSVGKRHLRNILSLGYTDVSVISRSGKLPVEFLSLKVYSIVEDALQNNSYDTVFICTPSSQHITDLLQLLNDKVQNIYIEKPVSHNYKNINDVLGKTGDYTNKIIVGFDLHFHPAVQKAKELIDEKKIGEIISVNAFVGQHLSQWRPYEDYKKGMSAKKETGGGVLLDLIHEFDYLYWLLGDVETVACNKINSGTLEIKTEEAADVLLKFSNGAIGSVHLDYLQPLLIRNCIFTGSKGTIILDLANNNLKIAGTNNENSFFDYTSVERNDRFVSIVKPFLENKSDPRHTNLSEGLKSLEIVLAAKYSSENNCFVDMKNFNPAN